jgi:ABC-type nitrate/sulfonate/bicarbonate transport system substrate-binding protein
MISSYQSLEKFAFLDLFTFSQRFYKAKPLSSSVRVLGFLLKRMASMRKRRLALVAVAAIIALISSLFIFLNYPNSFSSKLDNISFADVGSDPLAGLVHIAQDQKFFVNNGINLTITNYVTGPNTINATLYKQVDMGTSLEYAFVANSVLQEGNLSIIGTVDKSQLVFLIARKDSNIENIADLQTKKIGLTLQMSSLFYLERFLELNNINIQNVTLVNLAASEYVSALVNGTVDAFVAGNSYVQQAIDKFPNNTVNWSVQSDQQSFSVVFCRNDWIIQHPQLVTKFLKGLTQAEDFVVNHPAESKFIIQKDYSYSEAYITQIWPNHHFSVSLDQSLILAMEDEARSLINNNLTTATSIPNFLNYVYVDGLHSAKPGSVQLFR